MHRSALITGITGQDGGYLAEQLVAEGSTVHGLVRPGEQTPPTLAGLPGLHLHTVELTDLEGLGRAVAEVRPDAVYNLAGISSVAESWTVPVLTARVNGLAVAALLDAVWRLQEIGEPVRFVQASSAEIFAGTRTAPQDETTALAPLSPYGAAKAFAHHQVQAYRARGLHASNLIFYNHESPRRPAAFVTQKIVLAAASIARGDSDELMLGNLEARRDWGWAPDYVDALVRASNHPEPSDYVIATGVAHSVRDFVSAAMTSAGVDDWEQRVRVDPQFLRPTDATLLVGDATRARARLGWSPSVTFDELVSRMVRHAVEQGNPA